MFQEQEFLKALSVQLFKNLVLIKTMINEAFIRPLFQIYQQVKNNNK